MLLNTIIYDERTFLIVTFVIIQSIENRDDMIQTRPMITIYLQTLNANQTHYICQNFY